MAFHLILIGLLAGFLGGLVGIGGGLVIVPMLVLLAGFSQYEAQGTSIATLLFPIGILAAYNYYRAGHIHWRYALIIAAAFMVGSFLGSDAALHIDQKALQKTFAVVLISAGIRMFFNT